MLDPQVVKEVQRLLALNTLSQKKIADQTQISRGSVSAIASGKRRLKSERRFGRRFENSAEESGFVYPTGPFHRCPICGARVRMPCLACQVSLHHEGGKLEISNS